MWQERHLDQLVSEQQAFAAILPQLRARFSGYALRLHVLK